MRQRTRDTQTIRIAARGFPVKNAVGEVLAAYTEAASAQAAVYPLGSAKDVQMYGARCADMRKIMLPHDTALSVGDGVWLASDAYGPGGQTPPWRVTAVMVWPLHTEATVEKAVV